MPGIIINSGIARNADPKGVGEYRFRAKAAWDDAWAEYPDWILEEASEHLGNQDMGRCTFRVPYGLVIRHTDPFNASPQKIAPLNIVGWWVQLWVLGDSQQMELVWQGRIMNDPDNRGGNDVLDEFGLRVETGVQVFVAYSGMHILQRIDVDQSWWLIDTDETRMQKLHPMNIRDSRGLIVGNASQLQYDDGEPSHDPVYLHSADGELWNREDYLRYIMRHYLQRHLRPEPQWTLGGDGLRFLVEIKDSIDFGSSASLDQIIRKLIDPQFGIDFAILPTDYGYEINVFALSGEDVSFGQYTMPKNTNLAEVRVDEDIGLEGNTIVRSIDHRYRRIKVTGRPVIVCFTLWASDTAATTGTLPPLEQRATLVKKWTDTQEDAYRAGKAGSSDAAEHDLARAADSLVNVFQLYGAKLDWDFHAAQILPDIDAENDEIIGLIGEPFFGDGQQQAVRRTLAFLPLKEGFDYHVDPPTDANLADIVPDFMRPVAWVYNTDDTIGATGYMRCEDVAIGVHISQNDWGVFLQGNPAHRLAADHWTGAADTLVDPLFDWKTLIVTLAIEIDWKLTLLYEDTTADDDGSEKIIEVPDAEYWYLAPETVIGIDASGKAILSPTTTKTVPSGSGGTPSQQYKVGTVLRNDTDRLAYAMAGALARYQNERARAELRFRGFRPFTNLLGMILKTVVSGGSVTPVGSVISSVSLRATDGGEAFTTISTGHAKTG